MILIINLSLLFMGHMETLIYKKSQTTLFVCYYDVTIDINLKINNYIIEWKLAHKGNNDTN